MKKAKALKAERRRKTSASRRIDGRPTEKLKRTWPPAVLEAFGAFPDFPEAKDLRRGYGKDAPREPLD
jgi:hypothetical protein